MTTVARDTALVVPCYDEAARLPTSEFQDFVRKTPEICLVFVDDGSRDATPERLLEVARAAPDRVQVVTLASNRGKAEAVRVGLLHALELEPAYVGYWDADLSTPLATSLEFRALLEARPEIELVQGARVALMGRSIERRALRHYVGRVAATAIALVLGLRVYDTQCGAKLLRVTPALEALLAEPFVAGWIFDVEILARLIQTWGSRARAEQAIYEFPLERWHHVPGSKVGAGDYLRAALGLLRIHRRFLRKGFRSR